MKNIRKMQEIKKKRTWIARVTEEKKSKNSREWIFKETMTKNFPELLLKLNLECVSSALLMSS